MSSPARLARLAGGLCLLVGVGGCVGEGALPPKARVARNAAAAAKDVGAREVVAPDLDVMTPVRHPRSRRRGPAALPWRRA